MMRALDKTQVLFLTDTWCGKDLTVCGVAHAEAPHAHACLCSRLYSSDPLCHVCSCEACRIARAEWARQLGWNGRAA